MSFPIKIQNDFSPSKNIVNYLQNFVFCYFYVLQGSVFQSGSISNIITCNITWSLHHHIVLQSIMFAFL